MIQLTRLNNSRLAVNSDLIKYIEQSPDTVITLLNGEKLVVRETTEEVVGRVLQFRRSLIMASTEGALQLETCGATTSSQSSPAPATAEGPQRG